VTPELFILMIVAFVVAMGRICCCLRVHVCLLRSRDRKDAGIQRGLVGHAFYLLAGVVISFATHMVGDIYVFGFLVVPPVAAMLLARKVTHIFIVSVLIGLLSAPVGLFLAFLFDLPRLRRSSCRVGVLGIAWIVNVARRR